MTTSASFSTGQILDQGDFLDPEAIIARLDIHPDMAIADLGAGSGFMTIAFARLVGETGVVAAVDILDSALEIIDSKAKILGLKNIQVIKGNLEMVGGSGLKDSSYDLAVLANVLFQNDDKHSMVQEAFRILKPGGTILVIDWKKGMDGFGPPTEYRIEPQELQKIIIQQGFQFEKEVDAGQFHFGMLFRKSNG